MKVVQFAHEDFAGVGAKIREALVRAGHSCRLVCGRENYLAYPKDLSPDDPAVPALLDDADVVIAHVRPSAVPRWPAQARRVLYVHGSAFRRNPEVQIRWAERAGALLVCSTLDLARHSERALWNPTPIDMRALQALRTEANKADRSLRLRRPLRVAHSPTSRTGKGTEAFLDACAGLDGVEPVIIEGVSNAECLRIKATCHVAFDSLAIGLQVSGIESMALGLPTLAGGDAYVLRRTLDHYQPQPYIWARGPRDIRAHLVRLRDDAEFYKLWRARALGYVRAVHDYPVAARRMLEWTASP